MSCPVLECAVTLPASLGPAKTNITWQRQHTKSIYAHEDASIKLCKYVPRAAPDKSFLFLGIELVDVLPPLGQGGLELSQVETGHSLHGHTVRSLHSMAYHDTNKATQKQLCLTGMHTYTRAPRR